MLTQDIVSERLESSLEDLRRASPKTRFDLSRSRVRALKAHQPLFAPQQRSLIMSAADCVKKPWTGALEENSTTIIPLEFKRFTLSVRDNLLDSLPQDKGREEERFSRFQRHEREIQAYFSLCEKWAIRQVGYESANEVPSSKYLEFSFLSDGYALSERQFLALLHELLAEEFLAAEAYFQVRNRPSRHAETVPDSQRSLF